MEKKIGLKQMQSIVFSFIHFLKQLGKKEHFLLLLLLLAQTKIRLTEHINYLRDGDH